MATELDSFGLRAYKSDERDDDDNDHFDVNDDVNREIRQTIFTTMMMVNRRCRCSLADT